MNRNEWLRGEVGVWRAEGLVDEATAGRLLARYPVETNRRSWGVIVAGLFGALMVGLGLIALFAANWDCFGRPLRAVLALTPVVICGVLALVAAKRKTESRAFWEPLGFFWCVAIGAAACLVAQTYQIGGTASALLLLVMLLSLPVGWLTRSAAVTALWPVYPVVWTFLRNSEVSRSGEVGVLLAGLALLALSLPGYIAFLRGNPPRAALWTAQLVTGFVYTIGPALIFLQWVEPHHLAELTLTFWFCALPVIVLGAWKRLPVWSFVGTLVACVMACPAAFAHGDEAVLYFFSLILGIGVTAFGVVRAKLGYVNHGACLLLFLILAKFFASNVSFTAKGVLLILCGVLLTTVNVMFIRRKRAERRAE